MENVKSDSVIEKQYSHYDPEGFKNEVAFIVSILRLYGHDIKDISKELENIFNI